jgi:hypothetical protein
MPHLQFSGLIRRTAPFCRILRHTTHKVMWSQILYQYIEYFGTQDKFELRQSLTIYGFTSRSRIFHVYGEIFLSGEGL